MAARPPMPIRRRLQIALAVGLVAVAVAAYGTFASAVELVVAGGAAVVAAMTYLVLLSGHLADDVEAARGAVLAAGPDGLLPPLRSGTRPLAEVSELRDAIARRLSEVASDTDNLQLAAVIAALPDGVVVATPEGLISAANHGGRQALGAGSRLVGTSLFGRLSRASVAEALAATERAGEPSAAKVATVDGGSLSVVVAALGAGAGLVLVVRADDLEAAGHRAEIEMDFALHDVPPVAPAPTETTALVDLPCLVLDTETTGMDPEIDRIVAIGAVRLHGRRLFRTRTFDVLVRPGRRIPASASAVHRITDSMVANAPEVAEVWPGLIETLRDAAVVGHHVDFDLAMLRSAVARYGLPWQEPLALDTARLAAALDPAEKDLDLAEIARRHGIIPTGRHTALGDSLVTAELYLRLVPRLLDRGVVTLGDAVRFGASAKALVAAQKATAWGRR